MMGTVDHFYAQTCSRCQEKKIFVDRRAGDVSCLNCGWVLQSRILDNGDETLSYDDDKNGKLSRTSGMTDPILGQSETVYTGASKSMRKQLERVQRSIADRSEKNILRFIPNINETCASLHLPGTVKETAVKLFVDVMLKKVLVVNKPAIAATCIYLACRIMQCPRVLEEIAIGTNIEASLIQRMQGEVLRGMQIVIRITKSADIFMRFAQRCLDRLQMKQFEILSMLSLKPLTAFPVIKEEKSSKQPLSLPNPHLPSFPCNTTPEYQMELQLPYLCLEEGMSLCERIAEYELLPENIPPQAVAAAVFVWLLLLLPDVTAKKLFLPTASNNQRNSDDAIGNNLELNKNWNTGDINNLTPNEKEQLLSRMLWPPVTLANIAEECYTSVSVVKNVMLRLYASMKVLLLLPASGTDESQTLSTSTSDTSFHKSSNGKNRNPPAQIHQRFARAFENFQIALAVESAVQQVNSPANVASPPVSSTGGTKKRKRSLSTGQSIGIMQPSSASNGAGSQELALLLDKLLTGEGEEHFIRSPLWKELITIRPSSQSQPASTTVSRVSSTGKLPLQQDHPPENSSLLQNTPPCANIPLCNANDGHNNLSDPKSDTKYKQIQQLSQGLFMSGRKRFKSML